MPIVTSTCDICGKKSELWTDWLHCRECCATVCDKCSMDIEDETRKATCMMCVVDMDEPKTGVMAQVQAEQERYAQETGAEEMRISIKMWYELLDRVQTLEEHERNHEQTT